MRKFSWFNTVSLTLGFAFLYVPILLLVIYSFNAGRNVAIWTGWSTKWYASVFNNAQLMDAAWITFTVATLSVLTIALHLSAVVHAQAKAAGWDPRFAAHPIVAGLASLFVPGWGQVLAGHRYRAIVFLGGVWILASAWLVVTPGGMRVLSHMGLTLPASVRDGWGPAAMLSAPVVLWVIAVYDAAAGAAAERRV